MQISINIILVIFVLVKIYVLMKKNLMQLVY